MESRIRWYTEELVNSTDSKQRGNHGQPHQSHMMRFRWKATVQQSTPGSFVQQNDILIPAQKRKRCKSGINRLVLKQQHPDGTSPFTP
ncbi:hypothetical protein TNCV_4524901 [Trichonephila clavipes]|nr:hypothetical protein TNCV_4524901 [Trichonephila clavipes]